MKRDIPNILLINPWIHDFAAYDFWAGPLGLLQLGALLREQGFAVTFIDCLNRFHPEMPRKNGSTRCGRGPYPKKRLPSPKGLEHIPRQYSRYGILPEHFEKSLRTAPPPDLILVTSLMTYWYPGVQESIRHVRSIFPKVPLLLGGIYATLCHAHACRYSGADAVIAGEGISKITGLAEQYTGFSVKAKFDPSDMNTWPCPAWDLRCKNPAVPLLTSKGCPFSCAYCASGFLEPQRMTRNAGHVAEEIFYWHKELGVRDFAFYDDALLISAEQHVIPMLEEICRVCPGLRFHTPNAVHIREITKETAELMFRAGFRTLRLGLETTDFAKRGHLDHKVKEEEFRRAVDCLKKAGFEKNQLGAYLLVGLPGQSLNDAEASVKTVKESGITPIPAWYTPIPHTALWQDAVASSPYDLESDPVFCNNAVMPCMPGGFSWDHISRLKNLL